MSTKNSLLLTGDGEHVYLDYGLGCPEEFVIEVDYKNGFVVNDPESNSFSVVLTAGSELFETFKTINNEWYCKGDSIKSNTPIEERERLWKTSLQEWRNDGVTEIFANDGYEPKLKHYREIPKLPTDSDGVVDLNKLKKICEQ